VRAPAGLHTDDPIGRQRFAPDEELHVLFREDVVGDHGEVVLAAHRFAQRIDQRRLARADGSADANPDWASHGFPPAESPFTLHDRNKRE